MDLSRRLLFQGGAAALAALSSVPALAQAPAKLSLGLNENPYGPSPKVAAAVKAALGSVDRYVDEDAARFRARVAAFEGVVPEQVLLGEVLTPLGLQLALQGGRSSRFVYSAPGYSGFTDPAAAVGGTVVGVPLNDRLENDLPALSQAIDADTKALFFVNPHNPSGTVSERAALDAFLIDAAKRTLVIVDEAYLEYTDDLAGRSAVRLTRAGHNVVVFRTFAKIYGLAGLQIGYAIAPRDVASALSAKGVGAPRSLGRLDLAAADAALGDQDHVAAVRAKAAIERDAWHAALDGWGWARSQARGNFVFFKAPLPQEALAAELRKRGIEIGRAHAPLKDWTRVSLGLPQENNRTRQAVHDIVSGEA